MWIATAETANFSWAGAGKTEDEARFNLVAAFNIHMAAAARVNPAVVGDFEPMSVAKFSEWWGIRSLDASGASAWMDGEPVKLS